jgi:ferritin-like protein
MTKSRNDDRAKKLPMDILRDDYLVALNDLVQACREAALCYARAAEQDRKGTRSERLRDVASRRRDSAEDFAEMVAKEGDIPAAPSDEKEFLDDVVAQVKTAISEKALQDLLRNCAEKETAIVAAADALLKQDLEDHLREKVAALKSEAQEQMAKIGQAESG